MGKGFDTIHVVWLLPWLGAEGQCLYLESLTIKIVIRAENISHQSP